MSKAKSKKNIVVIGGGTGTSVVLEGLKKYPVNLSAIITTGDDGSSSGKLRKEFNMIPPGDIRQCLVALASRDFRYLNERFQQGSLQGHTLGNLLITLFYQKNKDFQQAIDELLLITGAQGSLVPMTLKPVTLVAKLKDGRILQGEKNITPSREIREKLYRLSLRPVDIKANPRAISAINNADVIVVGPGNLFSSILPNFLVKDIRDAVIRSSAKKIYIANLFTQPGHTDGFTPLDFIDVIYKHIGSGIFEHVIYNSKPISDKIFKKHANSIIKEIVAVPGFIKKDKQFIGRSIASNAPRPASASDPISQIRNPFLHDSRKLAKAIMELS